MVVYLIECEICGKQYTSSTKSLGLGQITIRVRREIL